MLLKRVDARNQPSARAEDWVTDLRASLLAVKRLSPKQKQGLYRRSTELRRSRLSDNEANWLLGTLFVEERIGLRPFRFVSEHCKTIQDIVNQEPLLRAYAKRHQGFNVPEEIDLILVTAKKEVSSGF